MAPVNAGVQRQRQEKREALYKKKAETERKRDEVTRSIEAQEKRLQNATKAENNTLKAEVEDLQRTLEEHRKEIASIQKEADDIEMSNAEDTAGAKVKQEEESASIMMTTETYPPDMMLTYPDGTQSVPVDLTQDPGDLVTAQQAAQVQGHGRGRDPQVWKMAGRNTAIVIAKYGPPNAAKYRREPTDRSAKNIPNISAPMSRLGEQHTYTDDGVKVYIRNREHLVSIQGVALPLGPNPLDAVDPEKKVEKKAVDPDKEGRKKPFTPVEFLAKWNYNGRIEKSWETRTVLKRLWPIKTKGAADNALFVAAKLQESRYDLWEQGVRASEDRSPSPNNQLNAALAGLWEPSQSPEPAVENKENTSSTAPATEKDSAQNLPVPVPAKAPLQTSVSSGNAGAPASPNQRREITEDMRKEFSQNYLEVVLEKSKEALTPAEKMEMATAWGLRKVELSASPT